MRTWSQVQVLLSHRSCVGPLEMAPGALAYLDMHTPPLSLPPSPVTYPNEKTVQNPAGLSPRKPFSLSRAGSVPSKPELLCKIEQEEEPSVTDLHREEKRDACGAPASGKWP